MPIIKYKRLPPDLEYSVVNYEGIPSEVYHLCKKEDGTDPDGTEFTRVHEGRVWFNYITGKYLCRLCGKGCRSDLGPTGFEGHA
jgi:hypothetical protein